MLLMFIGFVLIIPALAGWGYWFRNIFGTLWQGFAAILVGGIFLLTIVWTILSFFMPLGIELELGALIFGYWSLWLFRQQFLSLSFFKKERWFFFNIFLLVLFAGSFYPFIMDHFGYYVPTIEWFKSFGLTKGVSNWHLTLGQASFWHVFQAGFSSITDTFLRINTLILLIYLWYIFEQKTWVHLCFFPLLFLFVQSPSPDLPVIVLALMVLEHLLRSVGNFKALLAVSIFIFTIKPTILWLPVFAFSIWVSQYKSFRVLDLWPSLMVLLLFFIKNIWTFGFPIFPVQVLDFEVPWRPYQPLLNESSQIAMLKTFDMQYNLEKIQAFDFWAYVIHWLSLEGVKSLINALFLLFLFVFTGYVLVKKNIKLLLLWGAVVLKSILILKFSAQYRFFLDVFFVVFFVIFFLYITRRQALTLFYVLSLIVLGVLSFPTIIKKSLPSFKVSHFMSGFTTSQLIRPAYYELNRYQDYKLGNIKFYVPEGYPLSFDTPPPAIPLGELKRFYQMKIFPQKLGKNINDGLVWKRLSEEEYKHLGMIIAKEEMKGR